MLLAVRCQELSRNTSTCCDRNLRLLRQTVCSSNPKCRQYTLITTISGSCTASNAIHQNHPMLVRAVYPHHLSGSWPLDFFFLAREFGRFYVMDLAWPLPLIAHGDFPRAGWLLSQKNILEVALIFFRFGDYQLRHVVRSICLSVRPHGTTRLPMDALSWNLIFEYIFQRSLQTLLFHRAFSSIY